MRIYLAGKMDPEHGAWRDTFMHPQYDYTARAYRARWVLRIGLDDFDNACYVHNPPTWPLGKNWIAGAHDYVGPFRIDVDADLPGKCCGGFHGSTWWGQHGWMDEGNQHHIVRSALAAIRSADLVFAYLNTADCYGTIAEIGYAVALDKIVYVVDAEDIQTDPCEMADKDLWFVHRLTDARATYERWPRRAGEADEGELLREHLHCAIARWAAQAAPQLAAPTPQVAQAFSDIARWTSDPRVRNEARRMLRRLTDQ